MIKIKKNLKGNGVYDKTINYLTGSKLKDGEKHVLMWDNGKIKAASYSGPGTNIISALKENRQPLNKVDKTAQAHDIRYSLSSDYNSIKIADKKMVDKLNELQKNKEENLFNILPSKYGIQTNQLISKLIPEKYADKFVNYMTNYKEFNKNLSKEDKNLLENKLIELEKQGFGIKKRKYKKRVNKK
jgi:hypothetical protein